MDSHTGDDMSVGEVEPMPGYADLITRASTVMPSALRGCSTCGLELSKRTLLDNAYITWTEIGLFFICAVMWTQIRRGLTECLFQVDTEAFSAFHSFLNTIHPHIHISPQIHTFLLQGLWALFSFPNYTGLLSECSLHSSLLGCC